MSDFKLKYLDSLLESDYIISPQKVENDLWGPMPKRGWSFLCQKNFFKLKKVADILLSFTPCIFANELINIKHYETNILPRFQWSGRRGC